MEWTISFQSDHQIAIIETSGDADGESSLEMAKEISKVMAEYKTKRLLVDHSAISSVSGSTIDIYYRPQKINRIGIPSEVRIAEVVLPAYREHFGFLKSVCLNFGFSFQIFNDKESAIQWLTE